MWRRTASENTQLILEYFIAADSHITIELNTDTSPYQAPLVSRHSEKNYRRINPVLINHVSQDPYL